MPACRQAGIVGRGCPQQVEESSGVPSLLGFVAGDLPIAKIPLCPPLQKGEK